MTKRILLNFATRSRPQRFWSSLTNMYELLSGCNVCGLVKADTDDICLSDYQLDKLPITFNYSVQLSESKVNAINRNIPLIGWDILINMSDDIIWTVQGFDDIIREQCGPDDFVLFPEPYANKQFNKQKNELIAVVSIMGYDYYMRDQYIYHPSYKRTHCDNEATDVARLRGRLKYIDMELFYHEHPSAGFPVKDKQYLLEKKTWDEDSANYKARKEAGFP